MQGRIYARAKGAQAQGGKFPGATLVVRYATTYYRVKQVQLYK
jgi:hypothetical protein